MNKTNFTFEQLCIRHEKGYSFDLAKMLTPSDPDKFDDVVFKLITRIDTSLMMLRTHDVAVENFTIIAIPLSSQETSDQHQSEIRTYQGRKLKLQMPRSHGLNLAALQNAWDYLAEEGWHGLQSLALLTSDSIPDTGARNYSVYQFTTCIMDVIRANYMFQKFNSDFHHETLEMFDEADIKGATHSVFGLLWKSSPSFIKERTIPIIPSFKRKSNIIPGLEIGSSPTKKSTSPLQLSSRLSKRHNLKENNLMSVTFEDDDEDEDEDDDNEDEMEVDDEISFKNPIMQMQPEKLLISEHKPQTPLTPKGRRRILKNDPSPPAAQIVTPLPLVADIPLGFEIGANASKGPRKSMGRKSMSSDWPEEERQNILDVYDNLNPNVTEQKRIALTCKYVSLFMEKELPSKLLYQWIQKKGRVANRTTTTFNTPDSDEQKDVALKCYRELNENCSETARVSFTLKYLDVQYGLSINSKQLYMWLNEKPTQKRAVKKR